MTKALKAVMDRAQDWSEEDQEELAEFARAIEARRKNVYIMTPEERAAVEEGIAQAERGEFASDEEVEALWKKFGL